MLLADKKVMEANLKRGTLAIQYKLIFLHTDNLNVLSTNAALISCLAFVGLWETSYVTGNIPDWIFGYIYYFFISLSLLAGLLAYSQGSVEVIWGPVVALSGENQQDVSDSSRHMKSQQEEGFVWGAISTVTLIISMWIFILAQSGWFVGIPITLLIFGSMYAILNEGKKAYDMFHVDEKWSGGQSPKYSNLDEADSDDDSDDDIPSKGAIGKIKKAGSTLINGSASGLKAKDHERAERLQEQRAALQQRIDEVKGRGWLWSRSLHIQQNKRHSDCFHKGFIVVEKGCLDMYEDEQDFVQHRNPCNTTRIHLKNYRLELNPREIAKRTQSQLSATSALRGALVGTQEISFQDAITAEFDIQQAVKFYKFTLIPLNVSELASMECLHFMAEDDTMLKQWVTVLRQIIV